MDQLALFADDPLPAAPDWIEDLLTEMEAEDLIAANAPVLIIEIVPVEPEGPVH